mmetsp:Transcript_4035/g.12122  ORF Transcript_4035/g.12122 Transcript_4035/m.12122 type:complete len:256 (-) Transcript_4035:1564-2331(-)
MEIVVAMRYWGKSQNDVDRLQRAVDRAKTYPGCKKILVAVNVDADETNVSEVMHAAQEQRLVLIPVQPWGKVTKALNLLITHAVSESATKILFMSPEVFAEATHVEVLAGEMGEQTLLVGGALDGHHFADGYQPIAGDTVPWNTFAMWSLPYLGVAGGFPSLADELCDPPGLEELFVICNQRKPQFSGQQLEVKLIAFRSDPLRWEIDFGDDNQRRRYHEEKMRSKRSRGQRILQELNCQEQAGSATLKILHKTH